MGSNFGDGGGWWPIDVDINQAVVSCGTRDYKPEARGAVAGCAHCRAFFEGQDMPIALPVLVNSEAEAKGAFSETLAAVPG